MHLMLGCTPATPEFPVLSVCSNSPRPLRPTAVNLKFPSAPFSFPCRPSPSFSLTPPSVLQCDRLRQPLLSFSRVPCPLRPLPPPSVHLTLARHINKRTGTVRGLKLNNLCPTALKTQTGCSRNIKKPQTPKKSREAGLD